MSEMALSTTEAVAEASRSAPRVDRRTKLLYGVGDIAMAIKAVLFGLFTLFFYTSVMGLSGTLVGIAAGIGLVWDALIDPYIGSLSDRTRSRFGRRYPFMLAGALSMGISLWLFFAPPRGLSALGMFLWLLGTGLLVRTTTSVFGVPYFALGAELSQDYHERTQIAGIRGIVALVGTLITAGLSFLVFFPDRVPGVDPKLNYASYPAMGFTFGLLMTLAGLIATFGTRHSGTNPAADGPSSSEAMTFFADFVQSLRNPDFRVMFASVSLFFLAVAMNITLSIHYYTHYVKITASNVLSGFQVVFYISGAVGVVVWLRVSRHVEKRRLYLFCAVMTALLLLGARWLLGEGSLFGVGNPVPVLVGHGLAGFFGSILWFMPGSMIADIADEDELATGQRREGSFFGVFFFGQQLATGIAALAAGVLIDYYAGLVPGQATQSAQTIQRVATLYSVLPAVLVLMAAGLATRYTLTHARLLEIQRQLARRRCGMQ